MNLKIKINKQQCTFRANSLNDAMRSFYWRFPLAGRTMGKTSIGSKYNVCCDAGDRKKYIYLYNVNVFKRGKYKGENKRYIFYVYKIPFELLNIIKMDITQNRRYFKITQYE